MSDELWRWDTVRLADAIRKRAVSSKEAVAACLARLEAVNPQLNAVVETLAAEALTLAERADQALAKDDSTGPLHGIPITTKINTDVARRATASPPLRT